MTLDELIARGLISPGAAARVGLDIGSDSVAVPPPDQQLMPLTPEMSDIITSQQQGGRFAPVAKAAGEYFMPVSNMRYPDTPEARQAYDEALRQAHAAGGGKLPPVPGSPRFTPAQGYTADLLANVGFKAAGALKGLGALKGAGVVKGAAAVHPAWISQRIPTAKGATENPFTQQLLIDTDAMRSDPEAFSRSVDLIKDYPNLTAAEKRGSANKVAGNFTNHLVDNLLWLHDAVPPEIRDRSARWYEGANAIARDRAEQYGLPLQSTSGVYAALSPRKDWFQNVSLGNRLLDIYHNRGDAAPSGAMMETARNLFPEEDYPGLAKAISKGSLHDMPDPYTKAAWIRAYDEANHSPGYAIISPEGAEGELELTKAGVPHERVWNGLRDISKGIGAIESGGDVPTLSRLMGNAHKVRNFYNNILDPYSPMRDVTVDTHAIGAGLFRPLTGQDIEVAHGLGSSPRKGLPGAPGSAVSGVQGMYPLYADAYRRAADLRGILPRQMQSITWEAMRGLFPPKFRTEANKDAIADMMSGRKGVPLDEIRQRIHDYAGGINPPAWTR